MNEHIMNRLRAFRSSVSGVAALEFALIAPVGFILALGAGDLAIAHSTGRKVNMTAQTIAQLATTFSAAGSTNVNLLSATDATTAANAIFGLLPDTSGAFPAPFGVALTSIAMTGAPPGCVPGGDPNASPPAPACTSYDAHVAWSGHFGDGSALDTLLVRPCDSNGTPALSSQGDELPSSPTKLPADAYSPSPILIADVAYKYKPLFLGSLGIMLASDWFGSTFSAYFAPRTGANATPQGSWIHYGDPTDTRVTFCAGYPAP